MTKIVNVSQKVIDVSGWVGEFCQLKPNESLEVDGRKDWNSHLFTKVGMLKVISPPKRKKEKPSE